VEKLRAWSDCDGDIARRFTPDEEDLVSAPQVFAERFFDLRRWTEMPRGGHFTAMEEPELFADELRAFVVSVTAA
jgi:pimeloyl-ACP methyl ester carboxylesterase